MLIIALTGGAATGKSAVAGMLLAAWGDRAGSFSADAAVHELLTRDSIKRKVGEVFGSGVFDASGGINRAALREIVFRDESLRRELEGMLHPQVQAMGRQAQQDAAANRKECFVHEIPLLYEVDSQIERQHDVVVAASEETQRRRLQENRGLDPETIELLLRSQMPLDQKMARADFVIWNDAGVAELEEQVRLLAAFLGPAGSADLDSPFA